MSFEDSLLRALERSARALELRSGALQERDLEVAFAAALAIAEPSTRVERQHLLAVPTWPSAGPFDLGVLRADGERALFELKWWGADPAKRYETLWDACKLASAVRHGLAAEAYLVAGAPAAAWWPGDDMTGLYESGEHDIEALCSIATSWWTSPKHDETVVPALVHTTPIARSVPLELAGTRHELRCCAVAPGEGDFRVPARKRTRT